MYVFVQFVEIYYLILTESLILQGATLAHYFLGYNKMYDVIPTNSYHKARVHKQTTSLSPTTISHLLSDLHSNIIRHEQDPCCSPSPNLQPYFLSVSDTVYRTIKMASVGYPAALLVLFMIIPHIEGKTIVSTRQGDVQGFTQSHVTSFLGIPYAAAPVGDLRFHKSKPHPSWSETRDALSYGATCVQPHFILASTFPTQFYQAFANSTFSEDCLFLNVYKPDTSTVGLPVMVWIHGGGFIMGSADFGGLLRGDYVVQQGNVIVVSMNYRLGPFGFLAIDDPDMDQNVGLLDQVLALEWVRDNIVAFGGDPNKVTIFGESAGSMSVNYQLLSPLSKGLFHQAIMQSGSAGGYLPTTKQQAQLSQYPLAKKVGCPSTEQPDIIKCLQNVPADTLSTAAGLTIPTSPYVDGTFLPGQPEVLYKSGQYNKVPSIIGTMSGKHRYIISHSYSLYGPFTLNIRM